MTRIVIVAPWAERLGGAEELLWSLLNHLDRTEIDIARVVFLEHGPFAAQIGALGYATSSLSCGRLREPRRVAATIQTLSKLLRREHPDLVLSWMAKAHLYVAPAAIAAGLGRRCMWWQHMVPNGHWVDRLATVLPARAIAASSTASQKAQETMRPRRPTFVVWPGVDVARFAANDEARNTVRESIGFRHDKFAVAIVARLQPWKGQHHVIGATAALRAEGIDAGAIIVGGEAFGRSSGYRAQLQRQADDLGLSEHICFTGHVEDPVPFMRAADVLVNASASEPFGISVVEGMAVGLPVIAVDSGGPREIIDHGKTGILISGAGEREVATALARLAGDDDLRRQLGAGARQAAGERFSMTRMASEFSAAVRAH